MQDYFWGQSLRYNISFSMLWDILENSEIEEHLSLFSMIFIPDMYNYLEWESLFLNVMIVF